MPYTLFNRVTQSTYSPVWNRCTMRTGMCHRWARCGALPVNRYGNSPCWYMTRMTSTPLWTRCAHIALIWRVWICMISTTRRYQIKSTSNCWYRTRINFWMRWCSVWMHPISGSLRYIVPIFAAALWKTSILAGCVLPLPLPIAWPCFARTREEGANRCTDNFREPNPYFVLWHHSH